MTSNLSYIYRLPAACGHVPWSFFSVPSYGGEMLPLSRRIMRRVALDAEVAHCRPTDTQGLPELRSAMAAHLRDEGVDVSPERILITNSYEEALVLTLLAFCSDGDAIAIEDPSQFCIIDAARLRGLRLIGIPMDDKGMRTDVLEALTARELVRIVVTSPRAQNPTGLELHEQRRRELYDLARRHNWLIFECDSFAPLHYRGRPQLPMLCDDPDGRIIYVRAISRGLLMNLGIAVATGHILERLVAAKDIVDRGSDVFLQLILRRLLDSGCIARQDMQMRRQWGDQLSALLATLERTMPRSVRWTHPRGGGSIWVTMPKAARLRRCCNGRSPTASALSPGAPSRSATATTAPSGWRSATCCRRRSSKRSTCSAHSSKNTSPRSSAAGCGSLSLRFPNTAAPPRSAALLIAFDERTPALELLACGVAKFRYFGRPGALRRTCIEGRLRIVFDHQLDLTGGAFVGQLRG